MSEKWVAASLGLTIKWRSRHQFAIARNRRKEPESFFAVRFCHFGGDSVQIRRKQRVNCG